MPLKTRILAGRYVVERPLGRGGMAEVYEGFDPVLSRTVAIKVLAPQHAHDRAFVARFRREARAAAALNHPGVVSVYDTGSEGSVHFIVMERVEGRTLADVIADGGPLDTTRAAHIAAAAADALAFAHESGLVHRDVKPGNIMLTREGSVKVMDFGIARAVSGDSITQTAAVFGTASYLSPEQARGERVDHRSDVYSLGAVLYEMLAGRPPFEGPSPVAVAFKHLSEDPSPLRELAPAVPPALEAVAMRALEKDPGRRYGSAREMAADLRRSANVATQPAAAARERGSESTEELPTSRTAVLSPVTRGRRSRRWVWASIAAMSVVIFALVLLIAAMNGGPSHVPRPVASTPRATAPTTPPATTSASPSPSPTTAPTPTSLDAALSQFASLLGGGVRSGTIDPPSAQDLARRVEDALNAYRGGNLDDALHKLNDARNSVDQFTESGQITSRTFASQLQRGLDAVAAQMEATPPPPGEGHGHGEGKGGGQGGGNGDHQD